MSKYEIAQTLKYVHIQIKSLIFRSIINNKNKMCYLEFYNKINLSK